ncbi:MAG: hypothetical protein ACLRQF_02050 [Thomasclavelia ramosa]
MSKTIKPNIPGINSNKVFTLRNIPDTYAIKEYVDTHKPKHAIVVGGDLLVLKWQKIYIQLNKCNDCRNG